MTRWMIAAVAAVALSVGAQVRALANQPEEPTPRERAEQQSRQPERHEGRAAPNLRPPEVQLVSERVIIDAPPEELWAIVGDFQDMSWHPGVFVKSGENGDDIGATRELALGAPDGPTVHEELYQYSNQRRFYAYRIDQVDPAILPVTRFTAHLTVWPSTDGSSLVEWRAEFFRVDLSGDPVEGLDDASAVAAVTNIFHAGLDALKARYDKGAKTPAN